MKRLIPNPTKTLLCLGGILIALGNQPSTAQWSESTKLSLADQIEAAAKELDVNLFPDQDESEQELLSRIDQASRFLKRKTGKKNYTKWMEYLDFDPLVDAIEEEDVSPAVAGREAIALRYRLIGVTPGLELTVLRNVRAATETLVTSIRFRNPERAAKAIAKEMESVALLVRDDEGDLDSETLSDLSSLVSLLEGIRQAPELTQSIRAKFSQPNLAFVIGESIVQSAVSRAVNECRGVDDCILGTRISGTASLNGMITADLQPSLGSAKLQVSLASNFSSNNTGYNGPVRVQTVGSGCVMASRALYVSESGVQLGPTVSNASLNVDLVSLKSTKRFGRRIIERVGRKRAAETKPQADAIAQEKLRSQVATQFDEKTSEAAAFDPPDTMGKLMPYLKRLDLPAPSRVLQSTSHSIVYDSTLRRSDQLAAARPRPFLTGSYDVAIQVHESMIENIVSPVLSGRRLTETQLKDLIAKSGLEVSAPTAKSDATKPGQEDDDEMDDDLEEDDAKKEPPFEIDFARQRPIVFEADQGQIRIGIRGTRFAQGKRELKQALEITATYRPGRLGDGQVMLFREGETEIDFPGSKKRLSISQAGLRRTIESKFKGVFPEKLLAKTFTVPADSKVKSLAGRKFRPTLVEANDRWLSIGAQ